MTQISLYESGERNYHKLTGPTGPLVYPGAHVQIYRILYWVTGKGERVGVAQWIFGGVYLGSLAVVLQCYRLAKVCIQFPNSREYEMGMSRVISFIPEFTYTPPGPSNPLPLNGTIPLIEQKGSALGIPPTHRLQTPALHFPPPLLQRLFRRPLPFRSHPSLPEKPMAFRVCALRYWFECENDVAFAVAGGGIACVAEIGGARSGYAGHDFGADDRKYLINPFIFLSV